MTHPPARPVRRRLDLKAQLPAGGGPEYLAATLIDDDDQERHDAHEACVLPHPDQPLGDTGLTVLQFLAQWRDGATGLDVAARQYGRLLYRKLFEEPTELHDAWQKAMQLARAQGTGLRLEIRCPVDTHAHWQGLPLSALPFELMCDDRGYVFRRSGWSTVRRARHQQSRQLHWHRDTASRARVQVAWANVRREALPPMDEQLFEAHADAVASLDQAGRAERLPPLPRATRQALATALQQARPHVLVWIGHGLASGSGLLLHDVDDPGYPGDLGQVVSASDFAAAVREGQVDVALLWSCHGAGSFRALDVGVAEALLDPDRGDVAAVLASFSALDAQAVARLSKDLITAWAHGDGDLEAALARARAQLDEASLTWARPVLFLRTPPQDPSPRLPLHAAAAPLPGPAQPGRLRWLPPAPPHTARYIDRHQRLAQLHDDLRHHPVVVLEGLAGAGKTELALALAHALRQRDEDVAFIDLSGQRSLGPLRQTLGLMVSANPFEDDAPLLAALAGRRWTLVLDNAEDVLDDHGLREDLLQLLAALRATGTGFRAVVTSRRALASAGTPEAEGLFHRQQTLLDASESAELFVAAAGPRLAPEQASAELLQPLLDELGGIPRAIVLMAGQLGGGVDVPELQRRLAALGAEAIVEHDLFGEELPAALDRRLHKSRLASALNLSLASAERHASAVPELFEVLGTFPAGLLQGLLPRSRQAELGDALTALLDHHLVQLVGEERRIVMAAPVRAWARRRWAARARDAQAPGGLLEALHQELAAYMSRLDDQLGTRGAQAARLRYLADAANAAEVLSLRADKAGHGADDLVFASLFRTAALFAQHGGTARQSLTTLAPLADRIMSNGSGRCAPVVALYVGQLKLHTDDLAGARQAYAAALPLFRLIEDRLGEANTLKALGDLMLRTDDLAGARQAYDAALPLYRLIEDRLGEANTLKALGDLMLRTDDLAGARRAYDAALPLFRLIEDRLGEANTLQALGDLMRRTDDLAGARRAYDAALPLYRLIEARLGEANTLKALGDLMRRINDLAGARQAYDAALPLFRLIEDRLGEANALKALGDLMLRTDDLAGARQAYNAALPLFRLIEDRLGEANAQRSLGDLMLRTNDLTGARQAYDAALPLYRQIEDRLGEANTLLALGDLMRRTDDLAGARQTYDAALPLYRQIEDRLGEANTLLALGDLMRRTTDLPGARQAYDAALPLYRQIEDRLGEANTFLALGNLMRRIDDLAGARQAYDAALPLYRQIEARLGEANALLALGDLMRHTADLAGARLAYDAALPLYRQIEARLSEANTLQALGLLSLAEGEPRLAFALTAQAHGLHIQLANQLGVAATHGYLARIAASVDAMALAVVHGGRAYRLLVEIDDRFGQTLALTDLGKALLPDQAASGLAAWVLAQATAEVIGDDRRAAQLDKAIQALRPDDVSEADFAAHLDALRQLAPQLLDDLFAQAEAAVARGEIDPLALPEPDTEDRDGD